MRFSYLFFFSEKDARIFFVHHVFDESMRRYMFVASGIEALVFHFRILAGVSTA